MIREEGPNGGNRYRPPVRVGKLFHSFAQVKSENNQSPLNEMQFADRTRIENGLLRSVKRIAYIGQQFVYFSLK